MAIELMPIAAFDAAPSDDEYLVQNLDGSLSIASYKEEGWIDIDTEDDLEVAAFAGPITPYLVAEASAEETGEAEAA